MTKTIDIAADVFALGSDTIRYVGPRWIEDLAVQLDPVLDSPDGHIVIRSPGVSFASLYDWVTFVSVMERLLRSPYVPSVQVDFTDQQHDRFANLVNFLESIGTRSVLNRSNRLGRFLYTGFTPQMQRMRARYVNLERSTNLFGLTRIESKDDCGQFLDERSIRHWRENMGAKYHRSPLFRFDEVWRVLCHELAVNSWEHSGVPGFVAARIIARETGERLGPLCSMSFSASVQKHIQAMGDGLELCVADYGQGIVTTLQSAYLSRTGKTDIPNAADVLAFAFDEFGTSKSASESWATERHALGRILLIVAKYGGILTLRSKGAEVVYAGSTKRFRRLPNHLGFEPTESRHLNSILNGTQLQLVLPLEPMIGLAERRSKSILVSALPESHRIDHTQIRGHLVPLFEALNVPATGAGGQDQLQFREACERLCLKLANTRPIGDPLIFDFHELNWTAPQFETFLYFFQNIIQVCPVLLVQLRAALAREVLELETSGVATYLGPGLLMTPPIDVATRRYSEISETRFLDTYREIHCPVLGLDVDGRPYLFGAPTPACRDLLMDLIKGRSATLSDLEHNNQEEIASILAVLNNSSQLFECLDGKWRCVWSPEDLVNQSRRAMQQNFDEVVEKSGAWRGRESSGSPVDAVDNVDRTVRLTIGADKGSEKFSLPWQDDDVWISEFFESSRILTRGRYADEAAQLMIFRLRQFLEAHNKSLSDVRILAGVTAPALLLASAIHQWWPIEAGLDRPTILDLGYSLLLHSDANLPGFGVEGGVVIVQDVLSAGVMSGRVIAWLQKHQVEIVGLISLVQLAETSETRATKVLEWPEREGVPCHAMIQMPRPARCDPPPLTEPDSRHFWIEPRTLRPFQYNNLRGAIKDSVEQELPAQGAEALETESACLVRAGHYVIGNRHHSICIDVLDALRGEIGDRVATWIADLCEGNASRDKAEWESERGFGGFRKDVSYVLMPLNSQIYYLWPKVEQILAQRGRRQLVSLLDATLFIGSGPAYHFPLQLKRRVYDAVFNLNYPSHASIDEELPPEPLRILILDDAVASSRTILTILNALQRSIKRAYLDYGIRDEDAKPPIQWVRYFAIFNRMNYTQDHHWHSMSTVSGDLSIPFVFDEYLRCIGFPPPNEESCPQCLELKAIRNLKEQQKKIASDDTVAWLSSYEATLRPIGMSAVRETANYPVRLPSPIAVLPPRRSIKDGSLISYDANYADSAICKFYELMYRSYPSDDVFKWMVGAFPGDANGAEIVELEKYRWAVLEWGIRNWPRVVASGGRRSFFSAVGLEVEHNSGLVERLFQALACLRDYDSAADGAIVGEELLGTSRKPPLDLLICAAIDKLIALDGTRYVEEPSGDRVERLLRLNTALNLFFMRLNAEKAQVAESEARGLATPILTHLALSATRSNDSSLGFARQLYLRWGRQEQAIGPAWPLYVIAESLFRAGDKFTKGKPHNHMLLCGWLSNVRHFPENREYRALLQGSLGTFLAALEDLKPYFAANILLEQTGFVSHATAVMKWLAHAGEQTVQGPPIDELNWCLQDLEPSASLPQAIGDLFHSSVENIKNQLDRQSKEIAPTLRFSCTIEDGCEGVRPLVHRDRLCVALLNWTANAASDYQGEQHSCEILIGRVKDDSGSDRVRFRVLSDFTSWEAAEENVLHGRSWTATQTILTPFGVKFSKWNSPSESERGRGLLAACDVLVPSGFTGEAKA